MWLSVACAAMSSASMAVARRHGSILRDRLVAGGIRSQPWTYLAWLVLGVVFVAGAIGALPLFGGTDNVFTSLTKLAIVLWLPHILVAALGVAEHNSSAAQ